MATFPNSSTSPSAPSPSYGIRKVSAPTVRQVQFGDGYIQRTVFGLNQNLKSYSPKWNNISETDADTISDFLDARAGQESFDWTPPGESSSSKFICQSWSKSISYKNRATIQASFEEVAEP
jgi:phage-related protein